MDLGGRLCRSMELGSRWCRGEMFTWIPDGLWFGSGSGALVLGSLDLDVSGEGVGGDAAPASDGDGLDVAGREKSAAAGNTRICREQCFPRSGAWQDVGGTQ